MAISRRFKTLNDRISFLNDKILPQIKPLGDYTETEYDYTRSYILLVHAEIESYLEDRIIEKVNASLDNWKRTRKKSHCLKSIMAFCSSDINWEKKKMSDRQNLEFRIILVVNHFISTIFNNHGIKKDNILNLLLPIGIEYNQLDSTWLTTMENFGSKRGLIAHRTLSVHQPIDPKTEKDLINTIILPQLKKIDLLILGC